MSRTSHGRHTTSTSSEAVLARDRSVRRRRLAAARGVARRLRRNRLPGARIAFLLLAGGIAHVAGDRAASLAHLRAAASAAEASGMDALLASARLRLATVVGGTEGDQLRAAAGAWFTGERIPEPERTASLLAPGWHPDAGG